MKIATTYDNGEIFQHFGHTEQFKIYDIDNNKVISSTILSTSGKGHSALAELLETKQINTIICGGIGGCAVSALTESGISIYAGNKGNADDAVESLLNGTLAQHSSANCSHHGENHSCGHNCQ